MSISSEFVKVSAEQLEKSFSRIESCCAKLTREQIWARGGENQNSIGNLLLHLEGNVRQWVLSGVGGAADRRDRDSEFAARDSADAAVLVAELHKTVDAGLKVIRGLSEAELLERITVQGYHVSKLEAVYHVVEHFAGHTFQIIFATKLFTGEDLGFYAHLSKKRGSHSSS